MSSSSLQGWTELLRQFEEQELKLAEFIEIFHQYIKSQSCNILSHGPDGFRQLHAQLSKLSKNIEKSFPGYDFSTKSSLQSSNVVWKDAIDESLVREGIPATFANNSKAHLHSHAYSQLSEFLKNFKDDFESIFSWVEKEIPPGDEKEILLAEFSQYMFFQKLKHRDVQKAVRTLKNHIKSFESPKYQKIIKQLLTQCLFEPKISHSFTFPEEPSIERLINIFTDLYCKTANIPKLDPLSICNEVGTRSIPALDRLSNLLKGKSYSNLTSEDELPIELSLDNDQRFHSIFSCPVIKQQSTPLNPPYLLPCGHALSKESLNRLSKGNSLVRFKCPYCPMESNFANCLPLYF